MKTFLKWLGIIIGGIALLLVLFVWVYVPIRARNLTAQYEQFRAEYQAEHDAIDAQFNQYDTVVNGLKWHYVEAGNPDGPVILFLHGLPEGWYSWRYVLPLVDQNYRLIAIDMKGYGRSDRTDTDYDWHSVASQTLDLMTSLGVDKFYVVSHDWGTIIGSVLVSDHPERILGYVRMEADLIQRKNTGMISAYLQKPQWLLFQSRFIGAYMMQDPGWFIDTVYTKRMVTPFNQQDRDYLVYEFSRPGVSEMVPTYFLQENWDLDTAIGKICTNTFPFPILQLQADSDPAQPPSIFADIATRCPDIQIEWITNASHFDNFDQPQQVADSINNFVHAADH
jgi:pimeloyl-ACP methyl ester carboxylesterase